MKMMAKLLRTVLLIPLTLALLNCGGGGNSPTAAVPIAGTTALNGQCYPQGQLGANPALCNQIANTNGYYLQGGQCYSPQGQVTANTALCQTTTINSYYGGVTGTGIGIGSGAGIGIGTGVGYGYGNPIPMQCLGYGYVYYGNGYPQTGPCYPYGNCRGYTLYSTSLQQQVYCL